MKVFGDDRLAFKGQSVLFECQAAGWFPQPTLQWQVNDKKVRRPLIFTLELQVYYLKMNCCDILPVKRQRKPLTMQPDS